jgi:hypothetical protein
MNEAGTACVCVRAYVCVGSFVGAWVVVDCLRRDIKNKY